MPTTERLYVQVNDHRAGEQGRGFAVVPNAGRSAAAAVDLEQLAQSLKQLSERFTIGPGEYVAQARS